MYALTVTVEDEFLHWIKNTKTQDTQISLGHAGNDFYKEEWCEITKTWKRVFVDFAMEHDNKPILLKG